LNQELALEVLERFGLQVDVAENGLEAVSMVQEKPYDLVLMDLQMPLMDGLEATRIIRTIPALQDLPVLAMTANAFQEDRALCEAVGMNGFMTKPIDFAHLKQQLLNWLVVSEVTSPESLSDSQPARVSVIDEAGALQIEGQLTTLQGLLERDDMQAYFFWNQHAVGIAGVLNETDFKELDRQIQAYDLPAALATLKRTTSSG